MLFEILSFLLLTWYASCLSLPLDGQNPQNTTTLDAIPALNTSNNAGTSSLANASSTLTDDHECFEPPGPGEVRLVADQRDCFAAADRISRLGRWGRPLRFSRRVGSDVKLPVDIRYGSCYIYMDMLNVDDQDFISLDVVYSEALEIVVRCCSSIGRYKYGGRTFVGPMSVLYMIVGGSLPTDQAQALEKSDGAELLTEEPIDGNGLDWSNTSSIDAIPVSKEEETDPVASNAVLVAREESVSTASSSSTTSLSNIAVPTAVPTLNVDSSIGSAFTLDISSTDFTSPIPISDTNTPNTNDYQGCFDHPSPLAGLYQTKLSDCKSAAKDLIQGFKPYEPIMFARKYKARFKLPQVVRSGSCLLSIDVLGDKDYDFLMPIVVQLAAVDLARRCTQGLHHSGGGRTVVGPKQVVNVVVSFGKLSQRPRVAARQQPDNNKLTNPLELPSSNSSAEPSASTAPLSSDKNPIPNTPSTPIQGHNHPPPSNLTSLLTCSSPPLPTQRLWPITYADCDAAIQSLIGFRDLRTSYRFGRSPDPGLYTYQLPATFRYGSCTIYLDMKNADDVDTVMLGDVAGTARRLAYACSGLLVGWERYGGYVTVGISGRDLIVIWIYGRRWPPQTSVGEPGSTIAPQMGSS